MSSWVPIQSDLVDGSHLFCHSIAKRNPDAGSREHMDPESLGVAEAVIGALDLGKHDFPLAPAGFFVDRARSPEDKVRNTTAPRLAAVVLVNCMENRPRSMSLGLDTGRGGGGLRSGGLASLVP